MLARLGSGLALAAVAALALVGCSPPEPVATTPAAEPTVEPSVEPSAPSITEEAREAYEEYLQTTVDLTAEQEPTIEPLLEFATEEQAGLALAEVELAVAEGLVLEGEWRVPSVQVIDDRPDAPTVVACRDNSGLATIDPESGSESPLAPAEPRLVSFERDGTLRVAAIGDVPDDHTAECN